MSLEQEQKQCQIDRAHPYVCTYPENLVRIGPVHCEITGLQEDHQKSSYNAQPFGMHMLGRLNNQRRLPRHQYIDIISK